MAAARRVADTIVQGVGALDTFPERGRRGRVEGTRELVFASLPFVAVYEVLEHTGSTGIWLHNQVPYRDHDTVATSEASGLRRMHERSMA